MTRDVTTITPADFGRALRKGHGRCIQTLDVRPWREFQEQITDACVHHGGFDPQCEGSRAQYVMDLIDRTDAAEYFRDRVLDALPTAEGWDAGHLCEIAARFAKKGDDAAKSALDRRLREGIARGDFAGRHEVVELDGLAGLVEMARQIGQWLRAGDGRWEDDELVSFAAGLYGEANAWGVLDAAGTNDADVKLYADEVRRNQEMRKRRGPSAYLSWSFSQARDAIDSKAAVSKRWLALWGRRASDADLAAAARKVSDATDRTKAATWLNAFDFRPFPLDPEPVIGFARSDDETIARAAIRALKHTNGQKVRDLALDLIEHGRDGAIGLLEANYWEGDHLLIERAMAKLSGDDELHSMGLDVLNVFDAHTSPACEAVMLDLYERGPCSMCRNGAVSKLHELHLIPSWMTAECLHDSYEETRELIAGKTGG